MKIGIIGTGHMGRTLGLRWAGAGHDVLFGSRDPDKARAVAARGTSTTRAGDFDDAAGFGDVVLYTVRAVFPSQLLRRPQALAGKVIVDCNNRDLGNDGDPATFRFEPPPRHSLSQALQADVPQARVVKAFNTLPHAVIERPREALAPHRVSVFLCADDAAAKATVKGLAEDLGFVGVDCGDLDRSHLVDGAADFARFQIGAMGLGLSSTLSIHVLPKP